MIYFTKKPTKDLPKNVLLKAVENGYELKFWESEKEYSYNINTSCSPEIPNIIHLGFSRVKGIYSFSALDVKESRSGLAFAYAKNSANCEGSVLHFCSFWVGSQNLDDLVIVFNGHAIPEFENIPEEDCQFIEGIRSADIVIEQNVPSSSDWFKRINAKRRLIEKINELDSLTMLEAQLDLLTRYVLTGEGKDTLEQAVSGNEVTTIHSDEKLIQTIQRQKAYIRSLQQQYFSERGDYNSVKISS